MNIALLLGNILALLGMAAGIYYLMITRKVAVSPQSPPAVAHDLISILRRRRFGSALMILIATMFLIATNWFSEVQTVGMSVFWLLLMILLFWLVILAGLDVMTVNRLRRHLLEEADRKINHLVEKRGKASEDSKDKTDDDEEKNDD
jgi:Ca2+/Na+ antiporter